MVHDSKQDATPTPSPMISSGGGDSANNFGLPDSPSKRPYFFTPISTSNYKPVARGQPPFVSAEQLLESIEKRPNNTLIVDCRDALHFQQSRVLLSINISPAVLQYALQIVLDSATTSNVDSFTTSLIEDKFDAYEDKIFFRQREFCDVVLYGYCGNVDKMYEYCDQLSDNEEVAKSPLYTSTSTQQDFNKLSQESPRNGELCSLRTCYTLYQILKRENANIRVYILEGGFDNFVYKYPNYCESPRLAISSDAIPTTGQQHLISEAGPHINAHEEETLAQQAFYNDSTASNSSADSDTVANSSTNIGSVDGHVDQSKLNVYTSQDVGTSLEQQSPHIPTLNNHVNNCTTSPLNTVNTARPTVSVPSTTERIKVAHERLFHSLSSKITCELPSCVLPFLYLGSAQNAFNKKQLQHLEINNILNTAKECINYYHKPQQSAKSGTNSTQQTTSFNYLKILLVDDENEDASVFFEQTFDFIEQARLNKEKVLVHCFMGISRSATIVIAYLMKYKKWSLKRAFKHVRERRSIIDPNFGFLRQLVAYELKLYGKCSLPYNPFVFPRNVDS